MENESPNIVLGHHAIIDLSGCSSEIINDHKLVYDILVQTAQIAKVTVVGSLDRSFTPQGYTAILVLEESHLSIHTWPEYNHVSIDLYSCNLQTDFHAIKDFLVEKFQAVITKFTLLKRGSLKVANANGCLILEK